jgi:hypothetical protein
MPVAEAAVAIPLAQPGQAALVVVAMATIQELVRGQTEQQILAAAVAVVVTTAQEPQAMGATEVLVLSFWLYQAQTAQHLLVGLLNLPRLLVLIEFM